MSNFGALTDHFTAMTSLLGLTLKSGDKIPTAKTRADAPDENGDFKAATWHGATDIFDVTNTYELQSGTLDTADLQLGEIAVGTIVGSIAIGTSNSGVPTVTITGRTGTEAVTAPALKLNTYTLPTLTITGGQFAQPIGFTYVGTLTDCSIDFSLNIGEYTDGLGVQSAHGVSGAAGNVSASFVNAAGAATTWAMTLAGLTSTQEPGESQPDAAYHTLTAAAEMILARDAAPED